MRILDKIREENHAKVVEILTDDLETQKFAKNHANYVKDKIENLKTLVHQLSRRYYMPLDSLDNIIEVFQNICRENIIKSEYHEIILKAFKGFLFIQALSEEQLIYLKDLGVNLNASIYMWGTQRLAGVFFEGYFRSYNNKDIKNNSLVNVIDDYEIEQVIKTLHAYKTIVKFNFDEINISNGYVYNIDKVGKLLAVSATGESNKIIIWDMDTCKYEPIASLAGLYEGVTNVKITRINNEVIVTAKGERQIYLWNMTLRNEKPKSIFKVSTAGIEEIRDYILYKANDGLMYIIGLTYENYDKNLAIWDMNGSELPIKNYKPENGDAFIFDSKLSSSSSYYEMIGQGLEIIELKEKAVLEFYCANKTDLREVFDLRINKQFNWGNKTFFYGNICHENGLLGSLIGSDLYIVDVVKSLQDKFIIKKEGQMLYKLEFLNNNDVNYILGYCIYNWSKVNKSEAISCWKIEDMKITEERQWFYAEQDVLSATILQCSKEIKIVFNQKHDNVIYFTSYDSNEYTKFYELPKTFSVLEIASE